MLVWVPDTGSPPTICGDLRFAPRICATRGDKFDLVFFPKLL